MLWVPPCQWPPTRPKREQWMAFDQTLHRGSKLCCRLYVQSPFVCFVIGDFYYFKSPTNTQPTREAGNNQSALPTNLFLKLRPFILFARSSTDVMIDLSQIRRLISWGGGGPRFKWVNRNELNLEVSEFVSLGTVRSLVINMLHTYVRT